MEVTFQVYVAQLGKKKLSLVMVEVSYLTIM